MTTERGLRIGEMILGLLVLALGLFIAVQAWLMPVTVATAAVGPKLFPALVAAGLVATSAFLLREAITGALAHRSGFELDWWAVGLVMAALLAQILLLRWIGWILASMLLFVAVARAFGSRRLVLNAFIGIVLGGLTFCLFDYGLDLNLPTGDLVQRALEAAGGPQ